MSDNNNDNNSNDNSIGRVGKRMPYRVPEGFFGEMEERIVGRAVAERKRRRLWQPAWRWAAAAAVAAAVALAGLLPAGNSAPDFDAVAQAFDGLSPQDQEYVIDIYQDDIFQHTY